MIQTDDMVQSLDLMIEYDHKDMDMVKSMTVRTTYQGKEIVAIGTVWPFDDAYSELQRKLPETCRSNAVLLAVMETNVLTETLRMRSIAQKT